MKKRTLLAGLFLSLTISAARAQTESITSYLPQDGQDYRGYCIEQTKFKKEGPGFIAVGNRNVDGKVRNTLHLLAIEKNAPTNAKGQVLQFPQYVDVRAIALTMKDETTALLLVQARMANGEVHPVVVYLDCSTPGNVTAQNRFQLRGESQYPTSIALSPDKSRLYIAGFTTQNISEQEPTMQSSKVAFVANVELATLDVVMNQYNTVRFPSTSNDYDVIQRIRFIKDRLLVVGSVNDITASYNTSKVWVAQLEPKSLNVVQQSFFGNDAFSGEGFQGVDVTADVKDPEAYNVVSNDYHWHTWCLSRVDGALKIMPGSGSFKNTVTYGYSADIKGCGVLTQQSGRVSVYGNMSSGSPAPPVNVAPYSAGAVPFIASFDPTIDATDGLVPANLTWFNEGNQPAHVTALPGRYTPYWLSSNLSYWSIPAFAILADPADDPSGLAMVGHVGYKFPNLAPRLIQTDQNGKVSGCDGSVNITDDVKPGVVGIILNDIPLKVDESDVKLSTADLGVEFKEMPHAIRSCPDKYNPYYRTAQTTGVTNVQNGSLILQSVAPNPAKDRVTLTWNGNLQTSDVVRLELTDIAGRKVGEAVLVSHATRGGTFSLPALAPGLYIANCTINGKPAGQQKLSID